MAPNVQEPTFKKQPNINNAYHQDKKPTDNNDDICANKQNHNDIDSFLTQQTRQNEVPIQDDDQEATGTIQTTV